MDCPYFDYSSTKLTTYFSQNLGVMSWMVNQWSRSCLGSSANWGLEPPNFTANAPQSTPHNVIPPLTLLPLPLRLNSQTVDSNLDDTPRRRPYPRSVWSRFISCTLGPLINICSALSIFARKHCFDSQRTDSRSTELLIFQVLPLLLQVTKTWTPTCGRRKLEKWGKSKKLPWFGRDHVARGRSGQNPFAAVRPRSRWHHFWPSLSHTSHWLSDTGGSFSQGGKVASEWRLLLLLLVKEIM